MATAAVAMPPGLILTVTSSLKAVGFAGGNVPYQPLVGRLTRVRCSFRNTDGGGIIDGAFPTADCGLNDAKTVREFKIA